MDNVFPDPAYDAAFSQVIETIAPVVYADYAAAGLLPWGLEEAMRDCLEPDYLEAFGQTGSDRERQSIMLAFVRNAHDTGALPHQHMQMIVDGTRRILESFEDWGVQS